MPNWCRNMLCIIGPDDVVREFKQRAVGFSPWDEPRPEDKPNPLNFHSLFPVPANILRAGYSPAGYDWQSHNWGCKWCACRVTVNEEKPGQIRYSFDTPWQPPIDFLRFVSKRFPLIRFELTYHTEMEEFHGSAFITNGKVSEHRFAERHG